MYSGFFEEIQIRKCLACALFQDFSTVLSNRNLASKTELTTKNERRDKMIGYKKEKRPAG